MGQTTIENGGSGGYIRGIINDMFAELYAAVAASQPLDDDLTAIAALSTTSYGRALLALADAAGLRSAAALGSAATLAVDTDTSLAADSDTRVASQKAAKAYVDAAVTGLLDFKGSADCSANPNYPAASKGDAYVVSVAGKTGGASGASVDIGDVFVASADNAGGSQASVGASWFVLEHNLAGALLAANNLSDLANATTARANLGITAELLTKRSVTAVSASTTLTSSDLGTEIAVTTGSSNRVITMPSSGMVTGDRIELSKADSGTGTVQISGIGTLLSAPRDDVLMAQNDWVALRYDGTNWRPIHWEIAPITDPFSASGTFSKYPLAKMVDVECCGGGGGGGSGRRGAAGTVRAGGSGGGTGGFERRQLRNSALSSTAITVTIGAAGSGGAAQTTNDTNGNNGTGGGTTTFGTTSDSFFVRAAGGGAGGGGGTGAGTGGTNFAGSMFPKFTSAGQGASSTGAQNSLPNSSEIIPVAVSGTGVTSADAVAAGLAGYKFYANAGPGTAGAAGTSPGGNGGDGSIAAIGTGDWFVGTAPGSGASSITGAAGKGGDAVGRGLGGAGGGASLNGNASGAGGAGGPGYMLIRSHF